jgi:hypothetical protein
MYNWPAAQMWYVQAVPHSACRCRLYVYYHYTHLRKTRFRACRSELQAIEEAYMRGRQSHLDSCAAEMAAMLESRSKQEQEFTERYLAMVESYQKQLFDLQARGAPNSLAACLRMAAAAPVTTASRPVSARTQLLRTDARACTFCHRAARRLAHT